MRYEIICGVTLLVSLIYCGKPSLSDPLGLLDERTLNFAIGENYVFGTIWSKPMQESRESIYYTLDPHHFT